MLAIGFAIAEHKSAVVERQDVETRSRHPGGVQAAYCDGHIGFVQNNISFVTWNAIGTSQGGESTGDPQ